MSKKILRFLYTLIIIVTIYQPVLLIDAYNQIINHREKNIVDKVYLAKRNSNVKDNFMGLLNQVEASVDPSENEYRIEIGPISGVASANYVFASFFNPTGSGRTAVIKQISVRSNAVATANYASLTLRRISASSAGTLIDVNSIPKKNSESTSSIVQIRHTIGTSGVTFQGITDSRLITVPLSSAAGYIYSSREYDFSDSKEGIIIKEGEGVALYQEASGDLDHRIRLGLEWEEQSLVPDPQNEYIFSFPRVEVAAAANYSYHSFFNPLGSGKTAVVKKIGFGTSTCDAAAVYTNNISLVRTSLATGGTSIVSSNIPPKNTASPNSVMEFRRSNVTINRTGGTDSRLALVTPCGAAGQYNGWYRVDLYSSDEYLIMQPGEGIAVITEGTGDVDQIVNLELEWEEVENSPGPNGEYMFSYPRISDIAATANTTFYTFFNPVGSGKTAIVKRLVIRNNADAAATYPDFQFRRISATSNGTLISSTDLVKKHSSSQDSVMEARHCGTACSTPISSTYVGTTDSKLLTVTGPGAAGQLIGRREYVFKDNEKLVLKEGEGLGFYNSATADLDHYIKVSIEWDEELISPPSMGQYMIDVGSVNGSTVSGYTYASMLNPTASGKTAVIKGISLRTNSAAAAVYTPITLRRLSNITGGTQILPTNIPVKNTSTSNSVLVIRRTGVTPTWEGATESRISTVFTPGAGGSAAAPALSGHKDMEYSLTDPIILREGEGFGLYQESSGDADFRVKIHIEWDEEDITPTGNGEYQLSLGPISGNTSADYVYASLLNPSTSGKKYVIKRIGMRVNRTSGTPIAPLYEPFTIKYISDSSGGSILNSSIVPKKDTSIETTSADLRTTNPSVTFTGVTESRILGIQAPGAVNQMPSVEFKVFQGDEIVLNSGEGIALFQESASGDTFRQVILDIEWYEIVDNTLISIMVDTGSIAFGTVAPGGTRTTIDVGQTQIVTNDGNVAVSLQAKGNNTLICSWDLGSDPGIELYVMESSINLGSWIVLTTNYQNIYSGLNYNDSINLDLKIKMPTYTDCSSQENIDVDLLAIQE